LLVFFLVSHGSSGSFPFDHPALSLWQLQIAASTLHARPMNAAPLVSIIIPSWNSERLLPVTLRSIREQTLTEWECIIVDDGSADGTLEVARQWAREDPRFQVFAQRNAGQCVARNHGYARSDARAPYVTFMDHDDIYLPGALRTLVSAAEAAPAMAGVHGLADFIDGEGAPFLPGNFSGRGRKRIGLGEDGKFREWKLTEPTCFRTLLLQNVTYPPGLVLTRRAYYEKAGLFDPQMPPLDDWDMLVRLSRHGDFQFLDEIVVLYRNHSGNASMQDIDFALSQVRAFHAKTFCSPENTPEQAAIARQVWREINMVRLRGKLQTARDCLRAGKPHRACLALAKTYVEIHRLIRGYPTANGL
jgi:GT2 family glycosyltransferase